MMTESVGSKILTALTDTQAAQLLDIIFSVLDSREVERVLGQVSPDVKKTLSRLLSGANTKLHSKHGLWVGWGPLPPPYPRSRQWPRPTPMLFFECNLV